jgi:hypothetical protein
MNRRDFITLLGGAGGMAAGRLRRCLAGSYIMQSLHRHFHSFYDRCRTIPTTRCTRYCAAKRAHYRLHCVNFVLARF